MAEARVVMDPQEVANFLRSPDGPVLRYYIERGNRIKQRAQRQVGKDTHKLEYSIVTRIEQGPQGPVVLVGSDEPHALLHHEGTAPHVIEPRTARVLRFPTAQGVVYATRVNHPGTKPNRYLVDSARAEGVEVSGLAG